MDILLARQPIYDTRLRVAGYELLYRGIDGTSAHSDGDRASAKVAVNCLLELGCERVLGEHKAFINASQGFLLDEHYVLLPPERTVLEVLETVEPTPEVITAVRRARDSGYTIALDDFLYRPQLEPLVDLADIVKVDLRAMELSDLRKHARLLERPGLRLLAEKVETQEEFHYSREAGYDLFQGYFFCRPSVLQAKRAPSDRMTLLELLARIHDPDAEVEDIEALVACNAALGYRLLRFVNSALIGLPRKVDSLRNAIVMLGLRRVRTCVVMLLFAGFDDKPHELTVTGLMRARMCQLLAEVRGRVKSDPYFTVGLFSILDALMDQPMETLVAGLPLSDEVRGALTERTGEAGEILSTVIAHERSAWDELVGAPAEAAQVQRAYLEALSWAGELEKKFRLAA